MNKENSIIIKRIMMVVAFYAINFGLWEVLVFFMPNVWASFSVSAVLFLVTFLLLGKQLKEEWGRFKESLRMNRRFINVFPIFLIAYFLLGGILLFISSKLGINITPQNNENISTQLHTIPIYLTFIQTCIFAPIIEEMTFRFSIIGKVNKDKKIPLILLSIVSVVLFDAIHIFNIQEFFYYLVPSLALTGFYVMQENIIATIILHSTINIIGTFMLLVM